MQLENNILNRQVRLTDKIKKQISTEKFASLTEDEKQILHMAHVTGKITTSEVSEAIGKGRTYTVTLLKKLTTDELLIWHGSSHRDPTQYYSFNHSVK